VEEYVARFEVGKAQQEWREAEEACGSGGKAKGTGDCTHVVSEDDAGEPSGAAGQAILNQAADGGEVLNNNATIEQVAGTIHSRLDMETCLRQRHVHRKRQHWKRQQRLLVQLRALHAMREETRNIRDRLLSQVVAARPQFPEPQQS
jgi:hypothetical protein